MVDAKHLRQALVPIIDVTRVHLIEHEVFALVILLPELRLQLIKVDRKVLTCTVLVLFFLELVCTLALGILDAPLARFALRPTTMTMGTGAAVAYVGDTSSVVLPVGTHVPLAHAASKSSIRSRAANVTRRWRMMKLVVVNTTVRINVEMALIMSAIVHFILKLVQLFVTQILILLLVVDRLRSFGDLLNVGLGLFRQVIGLL